MKYVLHFKLARYGIRISIFYISTANITHSFLSTYVRYVFWTYVFSLLLLFLFFPLCTFHTPFGSHHPLHNFPPRPTPHDPSPANHNRNNPRLPDTSTPTTSSLRLSPPFYLRWRSVAAEISTEHIAASLIDGKIARTTLHPLFGFERCATFGSTISGRKQGGESLGVVAGSRWAKYRIRWRRQSYWIQCPAGSSTRIRPTSLRRSFAHRSRLSAFAILSCPSSHPYSRYDAYAR